jgi:hypothetical protein
MNNKPNKGLNRCEDCVYIDAHKVGLEKECASFFAEIRPELCPILIFLDVKEGYTHCYGEEGAECRGDICSFCRAWTPSEGDEIMGMVVLNCTCQHEWQDKKYGKGKRLFNQMKISSGQKKYKCTVCGREQYD